MASRPPKQMTVRMEREDVAKNLVDIVNTMEAIRVESLRNFRAPDEAKLEYLRLTSELASCMQEVIAENGVEDYARRVGSFLDDDLLLHYDPLQNEFWGEVEPDFSTALSDLGVVVLRDDYVSEGCAHHVFQGLKYLTAPEERREEVYATIQPFSNLLSEELLSKPEVAQYVMRRLFLDFLEQSPEGYGMALQGTRLDTPEFVERLGQIGALFVDIPYAAFTQMRRAFPRATTIGDGQDRKARVMFVPERNGSAENMLRFFGEHAQADMGDAEGCLTPGVKNLYAYGKAFLEAMRERMGVTEKPQQHRKARVSGPSQVSRDGDAYVVSNITLYGPDGAPLREYPEIRLDASPVIEGTSIASKTQADWLTFYSGGKKVLPSLPLLYAILEAAYDHKDEGAAKELLTSLEEDFKESWLVTSTRFNYAQNKVWHDVTTPGQIEFDVSIPGVTQYLDTLVQDEAWEKPLRSMFMAGDIEKIPQVFGVYTGRRGRLWTPTSDRAVERAACVGFVIDYFSVGGSYIFDYNVGRSRGVAPEAQGAR